MKAILALDAGTTNVKAILVGPQANVLARSSVPLAIDFPRSGWVEQSAQGVWEAARQALEGCLAQSNGHEAVALGISNQRETLTHGQARPCLLRCLAETLVERGGPGGRHFWAPTPKAGWGGL